MLAVTLCRTICSSRRKFWLHESLKIALIFNPGRMNNINTRATGYLSKFFFFSFFLFLVIGTYILHIPLIHTVHDFQRPTEQA